MIAITSWEELYRAQTQRIDELLQKTQQLEAENASLRSKLDNPASLHAHCVRHLTKAQVAHLFRERMTEIINSRDKLEAENAALREDKERLDWLDKTGCWLTVPGSRKGQKFFAGTARFVIDSEMGVTSDTSDTNQP